MKSYLSELLGTMFVTLIGCCAAVLIQGGESIHTLAVAIAFGTATYAYSRTLGAVSGGHFNPAVSIAMWFEHRINNREVLGYIIAQGLGGVVACAVLFLLLGSMPDTSATPFSAAALTSVHGSGYISAFLTETVMSMALVLAVLGSSSTKRPATSVYATALTATLLVSIPISGGGLNPARALGAALIASGPAIDQLWLYTVAPISGAAIGAGIWRMVSNNADT